jgi:hypothetical protein
MTTRKGFAFALALVGAVALGALIGSHVPYHGTTVTDAIGANQAPQVSVESHATPQDNQRTSDSQRDGKPRARIAVPRRTASATSVRSVPAAAPALNEVLKPVLNKGADMAVASLDFVDGEQFATVAHAARNTEVPFMVLKHRVLDEGKTLEDAIREFRPNLNAVVEANRARAEAKSDIQALLG